MKKVISLLVMTAFILIVAGCKTTTTTTTAGGSTTSTTIAPTVSQGVTNTTIKVGNCAATSGAYAVVGVPFNDGIQAYFKYVNESLGGVNGRQIEFVHHDDQFDPAQGIACVDQLINDDKVFAIVGHFGTPTVAATLSDIETAGIPTVYLATGIGQLYNQHASGSERVIFPVQPIYIMEGRIMVARAIAETSATNLGVIYTNDDAGKDFLQGIYNQVGQESGIVVNAQQVSPGQTDVSSAVSKVLASGAQAVIVASIQGTFPTIVKELANENSSLPVFTSYVNASAAIVSSIATDVGTKFPVYVDSWVDTSDTAAVTLFTTWMTNFKGDTSENANAYAMAGWIAGYFFVAGLDRINTKDLTWDMYVNAMESAPIKNPFGGEIDYSNGQRLGTQAMALLKMDASNPLGWDTYKPIASIDQILGNN